ncbi:MAG: hypothetical protein SOI38_08215 [Eggerthellaceae bacterium]|jgi:hypothetical protein
MGGHASRLFHGASGENLLERPLGDESPDNGTIAEDSHETAASSADSTREQLLDEATTDVVKGTIRELYRQNAEVGDGGTADAIREERRSGEPVGGRSHTRKGRERLRQIEKILARNPDHPDRALLERLRDDLEDALGGA